MSVVAAGLLALLSAACAAESPTDEEIGRVKSAIVNGANVTNASLFPKSTVALSGCTGTIISPRHILTAEHCGPAKGATVTFYNGSTRTNVTRNVIAVYEAAGLHADPTTGAAVDESGSIADWAVLYLDANVPTGYKPALLASSAIPVGAKAYIVGVGGHDGLPNPNQVMRYKSVFVSAETGSCPLPQPPAPQPCRGSIFFGPGTNSGDSGGPLFTYTNDATKTGPLILHGDLLNDRHTSTAWHFMKIMAATGLSEQHGVLTGGTNAGAAFTAASAHECAAKCRIDTNCQAYTYTKATTSCQFKATVGSPVLATDGTFGIKSATGSCPATDAICRINLTGNGPTNVIGPPDHNMEYRLCGTETQTCIVDNTQAIGRYVAYGADTNFVFKNIGGQFSCDNTTFGSDPAPGVMKACYYAPYAPALSDSSAVVTEGATNVTGNGNIAFGANGAFNFRAFPAGSGTQYDCNVATFGDPIPNVPKACYRVGTYQLFIDEGVTIPTLTTPLAFAYGANGRFVYKVLFGPAQNCGNDTFGDPVPGVLKSCYLLPKPLQASEGQTFGSGAWFDAWYGSGLNGNWLFRRLASPIPCGVSTFGGDPDFGTLKACYGTVI